MLSFFIFFIIKYFFIRFVWSEEMEQVDIVIANMYERRHIQIQVS